MAVKSCVRPVVAGLGAVVALLLLIGEAFASCGSAACFMVTGSEAGVQPKGKLSVDLRYSYAAAGLADGVSGNVAAVEVEGAEGRRVILNEHKEQRTISQFYVLDASYGLTDRVTLDVMIPYRKQKHTHVIGQGEAPDGLGSFESFTDNGLGDIRVMGKYSILPTLRNLVVLGLGADLPTGDSHARNSRGALQEPTLQLGRRALGLVASVYQSYELIPHRLNQFASVSYRHSVRGPNSYRYGDEYILNGGVNVKTLKVVTLTGQFNWRYVVHDEFTGSLAKAQDFNDPTFPDEPIVIDGEVKRRPVPNTGSTMLAFSPGISVAVTERATLYFHAQVPIARDFNGGLQQQTGFLFGVSTTLN
ncbi:MAG: hypothetical protein EPO02_09690 [Nitrospirae bacterium]|nr:MAG: hypothetical protein EPO02_09690 [Nitrospirota bacterium]